MPCVIVFKGNSHDEAVMAPFASRLDIHQAAARIADSLNTRLDRDHEARVVERDIEIGILAVCVYKQIEMRVVERDKGSKFYGYDYCYVVDWTYENIRWVLRQSRFYDTIDPAIKEANVLQDDPAKPELSHD